MGSELQLEDVVLVDAVIFPGDTHTVAQQWEAGQGAGVLEATQNSGSGVHHSRPPPRMPVQVVGPRSLLMRVSPHPRVLQVGRMGCTGGAGPHLVAFVEEQTEVGDDDPELLPAAAVLELA